MALFNTGDHHEAMRILLKLLATSSKDADVQQYRRAIAHCADDLETTTRPRQPGSPDPRRRGPGFG